MDQNGQIGSDYSEDHEGYPYLSNSSDFLRCTIFCWKSRSEVLPYFKMIILWEQLWVECCGLRTPIPPTHNSLSMACWLLIDLTIPAFLAVHERHIMMYQCWSPCLCLFQWFEVYLKGLRTVQITKPEAHHHHHHEAVSPTKLVTTRSDALRSEIQHILSQYEPQMN